MGFEALAALASSVPRIMKILGDRDDENHELTKAKNKIRQAYDCLGQAEKTRQATEDLCQPLIDAIQKLCMVYEKALAGKTAYEQCIEDAEKILKRTYWGAPRGLGDTHAWTWSYGGFARVLTQEVAAVNEEIKAFGKIFKISHMASGCKSESEASNTEDQYPTTAAPKPSGLEPMTYVVIYANDELDGKVGLVLENMGSECRVVTEDGQQRQLSSHMLKNVGELTVVDHKVDGAWTPAFTPPRPSPPVTTSQTLQAKLLSVGDRVTLRKSHHEIGECEWIGCSGWRCSSFRKGETVTVAKVEYGLPAGEQVTGFFTTTCADLLWIPMSAVGEKAVLQPMMKVRIHGLAGASHLNGLTAVCQQWLPEKQRWRIQVNGDPNNQKDIRAGNLQALLERFLPMTRNGGKNRVLIHEGGRNYRVDSTIGYVGVSCRLSKKLDDRDNNLVLGTGSIIEGDDEGDGWLKVLVAPDPTQYAVGQSVHRARDTTFEDHSAPRYKTNDHVHLAGLNSCPQFNGLVGRVMEYLGGPGRRYKVIVGMKGEEIFPREASLSLIGQNHPGDRSGAACGSSTPTSDAPKFCLKDHVKIFGMEKQADFNGQVGLVLEYLAGPDKRYMVLSLGRKVSIKEEKLTKWIVMDN